MLFSSITFLYVFLPIVILFCIFTPEMPNVRNGILLILSLIFYAWGEPVYVFLMIFEILLEYALTFFYVKKRDSAIGRVCLVVSVMLPFIVLFYYKYFEFVIENIIKLEAVFGNSVSTGELMDTFQKKNIIMPIGISFYTFQLVSYCVDVYMNRVKWQKNIIVFATYVVLFPQLVAGPIVRYQEVEKRLIYSDKNKFNVNNNLERMQIGIVRFVTGLSKKILIANVLGELINTVEAGGEKTIILSWIYAIAVSLQIYFDFSGYSDMAIGLGTMLGFDFPENFKYPFISKSISEFWRRWHITLGSWFRDYIYIPMGGNKVSFGRWIFNILVVWLFTGLWHGADWNFVIWGLYFAVFLVIEKFFKNLQLSISSINENKVKDFAMDIIKHIYVVFVIMISFLIFHNADMSVLWKDIKGLFVSSSIDYKTASFSAFTVRNFIVIILIGIIGSTPLPQKLADIFMERAFYKGNKENYIGAGANIVKAIYVILGMIICTAYIIDGSFNPFLYFRF